MEHDKTPPPAKVKVQCTYELEFEVPAGWTDHDIRFYVEEHECPATGSIGEVLYKAIDQSDEDGLCWACKMKGENKLLSIERIMETDNGKAEGNDTNPAG